MRKLILLLLLLLPACSEVDALKFVGGVEAAAACDTEGDKNDELVDGAADTNLFISDSLYKATRFQADSGYTVCKGSAYLENNTGDTPDMTVTAYIYSNNATPDPDEPNAAVCTSTDTHNPSTDFTESYDWYDWTFSGCTLVNGTVYWFVLASDGVDGTDYCHWQRSNDDEEGVFKSGDGSTWTSETQTRGQNFILYY